MGYLANDAVALVRNIKIARAVEGDAYRRMKLRGGCWTVIPAVTSRSIAGHGRDVARAYGHLPNAVIRGIRNVKIARAVQSHTGGTIQLRAGRRAAIATESGSAVATNGVDHRDSGDRLRQAVTTGEPHQRKSDNHAKPAAAAPGAVDLRLIRERAEKLHGINSP